MQLHAVVVAVLLLAPQLPAQWIHYPTPGVPRTRDGKPNLSAPAPRAVNGKPDLSGLWNAANPLPCDGIGRVCTDLPITQQFINFGFDLKEGLPYQPWSRERMKLINARTDPYSNCITPGGPRMFVLSTMRKIVQTPGLILILNEFNSNFRQVFTDGRPLPEDPQPTWNGYSVGKWEGNTLVVQSAGYRDDQTLDTRGSPLTNAARVTERFRRPSMGRLEIEVTVDDSKAYTRPFSVLLRQDLAPDTELLDDVCSENEKDMQHLPPK